MKFEYVYELREDCVRPAVFHKEWNIWALIDTGAVFPVWSGNEDLLGYYGADLVKAGISFSGFGGAARANLYHIPMFKMGELIFPNFRFLASRTNDMFSMVLPATMFSGLIYEIDDKNHRFTVRIPDDESNVRNLRILDENGRLHVMCNSAEE